MVHMGHHFWHKIRCSLWLVAVEVLLPRTDHRIVSRAVDHTLLVDFAYNLDRNTHLVEEDDGLEISLCSRGANNLVVDGLSGRSNHRAGHSDLSVRVAISGDMIECHVPLEPKTFEQ